MPETGKAPTAAELHRRALQGDAPSFWALVRPHERLVYAVAMNLTRNPEEAQDLVHDVYVRAFSTLGNLRTPESIGSWLYSMTRNIAAERRRRSDRDEKAAAQAPAPPVISVPDMMVLEEDFQSIGRVLSELPEPHRMVLTLRYMNNMSCREIADTLSIGLEAAKSRLFEARKVLRSRFQAAQQAASHPRHDVAANNQSSRTEGAQ